MHPHDMKYIGFKHQRENKQNSDKHVYCRLSIIQVYCKLSIIHSTDINHSYP
jgi:hypothetical protein